jgi:hypothetical protein
MEVALFKYPQHVLQGTSHSALTHTDTHTHRYHKYYRLGDLNSRHLCFTLVGIRSPRSSAKDVILSWGFSSWPSDSCLLPLSSLGRKKERKHTPCCLFIQEQCSDHEGPTLMTLSKPTYLPKAPSSNTITMEGRFQQKFPLLLAAQGFEFRASCFLGRCWTTWVSPSSFCISCETGSHFMPKQAWNSIFLFVFLCVVGMTDVYHHSQHWLRWGSHELFAWVSLKLWSSQSLPPR